MGISINKSTIFISEIIVTLEIIIYVFLVIISTFGLFE